MSQSQAEIRERCDALASPEQIDALAEILALAEEVAVAPRHRMKVRQLLASQPMQEILIARENAAQIRIALAGLSSA